MLLKYGLCADASEALADLCLGHRIGQTIGYAVASAGTHAPDGLADGQPYCAATDLHVADLGFDEVRDTAGAAGGQGLRGLLPAARL